MNRQQRRARQQQLRRSDTGVPAPAPPEALQLCADGAWQQQQGNLSEAIRLYRRALALKPDFGDAINNLGCAYLAQGKLEKAADTFRQLLALMPEFFDNFSDFMAVLTQVNPAMKTAMARASAAWPKILSSDELLGSAGIAAVAGDPLLRFMLASVPVRDVDLERVLTAARADVLRQATESGRNKLDERQLEFCCALAKQYFINEYVFAATPQELEQAERLKEELHGRLAAREAIPPLWLVAVASYFPLHALPDADALLKLRWSGSVNELLTQQLREPRVEQEIRDSIPCLTTITDEISMRVRQQYEENPFPRWVLVPSLRKPMTINELVRGEVAAATFSDLDTATGIDVLVAGCGTGRHPIILTKLLKDARVLAVDLSLSSLCYAENKRRALGVNNIEFAQADVLQMADIGRTFDVIDSSGVLHHLADPSAGWRILLSLLRPGGLMHLGLYSELGRLDIVEAREYIAEHGYRPTAEDIRRCRQDLMNSPLKEIARRYDFFSTSTCRDLMFHVQEQRLTATKIKAFLRENNLNFIGFKVDDMVRERYRSQYPDDRPMTNLDHWHAFEQENPATFAGMYQFWVQKA